MSITASEKTIGSAVFRVRQLKGKPGRAIQLRLLRAIAASISSGRGLDLGIVDKRVSGLTLDPHAALSAISDADMDFVCETFARETMVTIQDGENGPKSRPLMDCYDDFMGGSRALDVWPWLGFCIETNFGGGFFLEVLARIKRAPARSPSGSPPAPTGFSGDSPQASE